jgi:uncharacterized damage-inducible protein DinB
MGMANPNARIPAARKVRIKMTQTNPYEKYLEGQNPMQVLPLTAERIRELTDRLGLERANLAPAPGKWSARKIVCHLADCELVFAFRLRQTLAEDRHVIQPFDQERWADNYSAYSLDQALSAFNAARSWNLALLRSLSPEVHSKPVTHPERGAMTFYAIVETMAGHDLNHLGQLEALAKKLVPAR